MRDRRERARGDLAQAARRPLTAGAASARRQPAASLRPSWDALRERVPLPALGAPLAGALLLAVVLAVPSHGPRGTPCPQRPVTRYLETLPKDAVIAGDPIDLMCLPVTARRPVVISKQLAPAYEKDSFRHGRARMFDMLRAYYGSSPADLEWLRARYGAARAGAGSAARTRSTTSRA